MVRYKIVLADGEELDEGFVSAGEAEEELAEKQSSAEAAIEDAEEALDEAHLWADELMDARVEAYEE